MELHSINKQSLCGNAKCLCSSVVWGIIQIGNERQKKRFDWGERKKYTVNGRFVKCDKNKSFLMLGKMKGLFF